MVWPGNEFVPELVVAATLGSAATEKLCEGGEPSNEKLLVTLHQTSTSHVWPGASRGFARGDEDVMGHARPYL